jgi:hypothetical protein
MPLMDSLQSVYGDKLQILMVNGENSTVTKNHLAKYKGLKVPLLPFITEDTVLSGFFPHFLVPHLVWVDPFGTVRYITMGSDASFAHVRDVLSGKDIKMVVKKDMTLPTDLPILTDKDTSVQNHLYYYSDLMRGIYNASSFFALDKKGGSRLVNHLQVNRLSAKQLFVRAFEEGSKYDFRPRNAVILQIAHPDQFVFPTNVAELSEWLSKYSYTYELMVPPSRAAHFYQFMQQDLERYFGMKATVEKRRVKCLALVRTGETKALKTEGGKFFTGVVDSGKVWRFRNYSFKNFFLALKYDAFEVQLCPEPLIDKTGDKGNIDIDLKADIIKKLNIPELNQELLKYGLTIKPKMLRTTVLVIRTEKNWPFK